MKQLLQAHSVHAKGCDAYWSVFRTCPTYNAATLDSVSFVLNV
jgi:hypothetical protein